VTELGPCSAQPTNVSLCNGSSSDSHDAGGDHLSCLRAPRGVRPSLIVSDLDLGSASEAGYRREDCAKHQNRQRASILRLANLRSEGRPAPFADFQRFFPVNSGYDRFLRIPVEEQHLKRRRAPVKLLSKGIRKRSSKPGDVRRRKAKSLKQTHRNAAQLRTPDENGTRSDDLSCVGDADGWYSPSIPDSALSDEPERGADSTTIYGAGAVVGALAESAGRPESQAGPENENKAPEDFFTALFSRAQENPDVLLQGDLPGLMRLSGANIEQHQDTEVDEIGQGAMGDGSLKVMSSIVDGVLRSRPRTEQEGKDDARVRSQFVNDILAGLAYAGGAERAQFIESHRMFLETKEGEIKTSEENCMFGRFEDHTKRFGSRMLEKMGFTGRLGATDQGIEEPLEGKEVTGRLGLGTKLPRAVENVVSSAAVGNSTAVDDLVDKVMRFNSRRDGGSLGKRTREAGAGDFIQQRHVVEDDIYIARRKRYKGPALLQEDENWRDADELPDNEPTMAKPSRILDEDDEFESESSSASGPFDCGRRAILVEFDVLIRGSHERRMKAFSNAMQSFAGIHDQDRPHLESRNLGDGEAVREILKMNAIEPTSEVSEELSDLLDRAFGDLQPPKPNLEVIATLKRASQRYHIGVMHRGTSTRLNRELKNLDLMNSFVSGAKMALIHSDLWPYERSWKELQGMNNPPGFTVAGRILGARTVVCVSDNNRSLDVEAVQDHFDSDITVTDSSFADTLDFDAILETPRARQRRRRVLALYSTEGLWYAAAEQFRSACKQNLTAPVFVRYFKWNKCEWVDPSDLVALPRRYYRRMRNAGFPGLLDSADVSDMV
jgi:hypothetical protein